MYMYIRSADVLHVPFHSPSRRLHYERVSQLIVAVQVVTQYLHPLYPMYPIHNIHVHVLKLMLYLTRQVYVQVHAYSVLYDMYT